MRFSLQFLSNSDTCSCACASSSPAPVPGPSRSVAVHVRRWPGAVMINDVASYSTYGGLFVRITICCIGGPKCTRKKSVNCKMVDEPVKESVILLWVGRCGWDQ